MVSAFSNHRIILLGSQEYLASISIAASYSADQCIKLSPKNLTSFWLGYIKFGGPGSSVGIATELRTGRSEIESRWELGFPPVQTGPEVHPASCKMGTRSFPGIKCGRGVLLTTLPLLVPLSWKIRATPLPTLCATPGL